MYLVVYVCMYVCVYACMGILTDIRMYVGCMQKEHIVTSCMYVCMHVWICWQTYVCMLGVCRRSIYLHTQKCVYTSTAIRMYVWYTQNKHVCIYADVSWNAHVCIYADICGRIDTHTYVCMVYAERSWADPLAPGSCKGKFEVHTCITTGAYIYIYIYIYIHECVCVCVWICFVGPFVYVCFFVCMYASTFVCRFEI